MLAQPAHRCAVAVAQRFAWRAAQLRAGVEDMPSHATVRRLYGNASNMFSAHGYRIRPRGGQPGHPCWTARRDSRGLFLPNDA